MKKQLLFLFIITLGINVSFAQESFNASALKKAKLEELKKCKPSIKNWEPNSYLKNVFEEKTVSPTALSTYAQPISPAFTFTDVSFGQLKNATAGKSTFYTFKHKSTGANILSTELNLLDEKFDVSSTLHFEWPEKTNAVRISETCTADYFVVYIHYFEGGVGPAFAKDELRFINFNGEIIRTVVGLDAVNINGKLVMLNSDQENSYYTIYDENTFEKEFEKKINNNLITFHYGSAISFKEMNGNKYFIIPYYEEVPIDNNTYVITPDNHFILEIYDMEYNLVKTVKTPVPVIGDGVGMFDLWPFFEFGVFSTDLKFDMSDKIFNSDDKMEFVFSICFMNLITTEEYYVYYVMDEGGNILHQTDSKIVVHYSDNIAVEGHEDQTVFIHENAETGYQEYQMFNINSWTVDATFAKRHNEDVLGISANRIKKGDNFEYIIGLSETLIEESGQTYGVIKTYNREGEETGQILLEVGQRTLVFTPILEESTLDPYTVNNDADIEYFYAHENTEDGISTKQSFSIAKAQQAPLFTIEDDEQLGELSSNGFIYDDSQKPQYMYAKYNNNTTRIQSFSLYKFPLISSGGIADKNADLQESPYYDKNTGSIFINSNQVKNVTIYNIEGALVYQGNASSIPTSHWTKGVYIVEVAGKGTYLTHTKLIVY